MYIAPAVELVLLWIFALFAVLVAGLLIYQTRINWKRFRQEASLKHKAELIVMLIVTTPIVLGAAGYLALVVLLSLGVIQ